MDRSSRDVILTCLVGFVAWLWTTHYLPSLRFVPYAFIAGILLTVSGSAYLLLTTSRDPRPLLASPQSQSSFLAATSTRFWKGENRALVRRSQYQPLELHKSVPSISGRLDGVLELLLRDFVRSWYGKISPGDGFSNQIDRALRASLQKLIVHALRLDLVDFSVTRLLPIVNNHVKAYAEAERLVRGKKLSVPITEGEELDTAIAGRYQDGKLHPAVSLSATKTTTMQQQHLRRLSARILPVVLPENMQSSASVLVLVREIVACAVLLPVMLLLTDPDILNQLIEAYGRSVLYERKTVRRLRAALEEHTSSVMDGERHARLPKLTREGSERAFEDFVRAIRQCMSLSDVDRFQGTIQRQIQRENGLAKRDLTYLRRLEIGRKLLEQRMAELSAPAGPDLSSMSLRELLYDSSGLAYFMEYMDGSERITLVQFWIVVDGFRQSVKQTSTPADDASGRTGPWTQMERDQLVQLSGKYLWKPELKASQAMKDSVHTFVNAGEAATNQQYIRAKQAIFALQDAVYDIMQSHYYPRFQDSDLWQQLSESSISIASKPLFNGSGVTVFASPSTAPNVSGTAGATKSSLSHLKAPELRRAVASSSDIVGTAKKTGNMADMRRSLDDITVRRPLFDESVEDDPLAVSTHSLDSTDEAASQDTRNQAQVMTAMQAALDEIVDEEPDQASAFSDWGQETPTETENHEAVFGSFGSTQPVTIPGEGKPSLSSLGLVGTPSKRTVFTQDDLFLENEKMLREDDNDAGDNENTDDDDIREAAPGDLGLSELVQSLSLDIEKLEAQQAVLGSLTGKAELTNNSAELRILRKSKTSLEREIHRKELQRQQYIVQRSENDLYGKANVSIKSIMVGTESDGHEYALYVVEVQRFSADEKTPTVTWAITRRYSEFHDLHRRLRKRYPSIRDFEFPRRQMVLTLQKDFLKKRSAALEKYLQELLTHPLICRSIEFRAFLSQQTIRPITSDANGQQLDKQDFVTRIYNSVTDGMEEFIGNMPVLDQLSTAGQNLITAAISAPVPTTTDANASSASAPAVPSAVSDNPQEARRAAAEISAYETRTDPETVTFIQPICSLIVELFQLNTGQNWLRGRAVVVVTQQLLGGTIERRVRESFRQYTSEERMCGYIDLLRDTMWPDGKFRAGPAERLDEEREDSRRNAAVVLRTLLPELAGGVIGRGNAQSAGRRVHATLNNERLNLHLAFTILDELVEGVLGVKVSPGR